ncbi:GerAB/ArcD/ProY family transporter [Fontibacillus sp. BL9]|uniref:GerAB/ArcD/ProY family transporter n=1 Tax=Fontibacillus sp. BL9 TaxID=3389971 RepID=UPI00397984EC
MNSSEKLTARQATLWFIMFQLGSAYLTLPGFLAAIAKQDAWISILITIFIQLVLVIPLYVSISKQTKGRGFGDYVESLFGKYGGKIFMCVFCFVFPFFAFTLSLWFLADFLTTSVIPATPADSISVLMLIAVISVVRSGVTTIGRSAEALFILLIVIFLLCIVSLMPTFHINNLLPVMENGIKPIMHGSILLLGYPFMESFLFLFFLKNMEMKKWKKSLIFGNIGSGIYFLGVTVVNIGVLGAEVTANVTYPSYFVIRTITLGDFFERFEILVSMLYYVTIFFRLSLLLHITAEGLAGVFRLSDHRPLILPLCLIALAYQSDLWPNTSASQNDFRLFSFYPMFFGLVVAFLLWVVGKIKRINKPS